jgi:16S rRNA processing protein RimM
VVTAAEGSLLEVGTVARAHGIRGDVVVSLVTNRLERVAVGSVLVARPPGGGDGRELKIVGSRPHQARHIVTFEGVDTKEGADALHGHLLYAAPLADAGGLFVHDLIGAEVVDTAGVRRGVVTAVEANPASDLLVVDGKWYVPLRFVVEERPHQLIVEAPDGLFD